MLKLQHVSIQKNIDDLNFMAKKVDFCSKIDESVDFTCIIDAVAGRVNAREATQKLIWTQKQNLHSEHSKVWTQNDNLQFSE